MPLDPGDIASEIVTDAVLLTPDPQIKGRTVRQFLRNLLVYIALLLLAGGALAFLVFAFTF